MVVDRGRGAGGSPAGLVDCLRRQIERRPTQRGKHVRPIRAGRRDGPVRRGTRTAVGMAQHGPAFTTFTDGARSGEASPADAQTRRTTTSASRDTAAPARFTARGA